MPWSTSRGSTNTRGYGTSHQRTRAQWARAIAATGWPCARCGQHITAGNPWHLDHDDDRTGYLGPSHQHCNLAAAGRRGAASRPSRKRPAERHPGLLR